MSQPAEAGEKIPDKWGTSSAKWFYNTEGESVVVHLRSGQEVRGIVVGVDTFTIVVEVTGRADPVLVMKHAIDMIAPD